MAEILLTVEGLRKGFGGILALEDLNLRIGTEGIYSIIGPNGAGKTTLFNCITGIFPPDKGRIIFKGENITGLKSHQIVEKGIVRTFQNIRLFKNMSVLENVLAGMHLCFKAGFWHTIFRTARERAEEKEAKQRALYLLSYVGLKGFEERIAHSLPYGMQRRLELARALAAYPKLLLLDEPTAGMLPSESKEISELLKKVHEEFQTGILLIEHDMRVVMEVSFRIIVLDLGQKIAEGTPEEIRSDEKVIQAYLGKRRRFV